jgi:hypothetical protein
MSSCFRLFPTLPNTLCHSHSTPPLPAYSTFPTFVLQRRHIISVVMGKWFARQWRNDETMTTTTRRRRDDDDAGRHDTMTTTRWYDVDAWRRWDNDNDNDDEVMTTTMTTKRWDDVDKDETMMTRRRWDDDDDDDETMMMRRWHAITASAFFIWSRLFVDGGILFHNIAKAIGESTLKWREISEHNETASNVAQVDAKLSKSTNDKS